MNFANEYTNKMIHILLNKPLEDDLTKEDLFSVPSLIINGKDYNGKFKRFDTSDLMYFPNLKKLALYDLDIKDTSKIFSLKNLEVLELYSCSFNSLEGINNITNLKSLVISNSNYINFNELEKLISLKRLKISNAHIKNLDFLKFYDLEYLELSSCNIKDFSILKNKTNIKVLNILNTDIDFKILQNIKYLEKLYITDNQYSKHKEELSVLSTLGVKIFNDFDIEIGGDNYVTS